MTKYEFKNRRGGEAQRFFDIIYSAPLRLCGEIKQNIIKDAQWYVDERIATQQCCYEKLKLVTK